MTSADILAKLVAIADFSNPPNVARAKLFAVEARRYLIIAPTEMAHGAQRIRLDENLRFVKSELYRAEQLIAANDSTLAPPEVVLGSMRCFRD